MKHPLLLPILTGVLIGAPSCSRNEEPGTEQTGKPVAPETGGQARSVSQPAAAPLLLETDGDSGGDTEDHAADNSRCHVCHMNYADELMAVTHARAGVGCERCHGDSSAHCANEDNIVAPDVMYAEDAINPACRKCHTELNPIHQPFLDGKTKEKHCTECHDFQGHRLALRTRQWDKKTGKLLSRDGTRLMTDPSN